MERSTILIPLLFVICSCGQPKRYEYIEIVLEKSLSGRTQQTEKEAKMIQAKTDSIAYLEAYQNFCISEKVARDMKEAFGTSSGTPTDFKLLDEKGNDIAYLVYFDNIDSLKADIRSQVFALGNSVKRSVEYNRSKRAASLKKSVNVDSAKLKQLQSYFNAEKDEFDPNGLIWHKPKLAPKYTNSNGVYCYFQSNEGIPSNLRLRLQYHADDWLFFYKVQFSIDGKAFEFIPTDTETDSGNGGRIWEWFDQAMGNSNTELLTALASAKTAKMKLIGRQYYDIKAITPSQITAIKRTLELYKAMGGTY